MIEDDDEDVETSLSPEQLLFVARCGGRWPRHIQDVMSRSFDVAWPDNDITAPSSFFALTDGERVRFEVSRAPEPHAEALMASIDCLLVTMGEWWFASREDALAVAAYARELFEPWRVDGDWYELPEIIDDADWVEDCLQEAFHY